MLVQVISHTYVTLEPQSEETFQTTRRDHEFGK